MPNYSLAQQIIQRPWLARLLTPVASWYVNAAGWRKIGLKYDDLVEEESKVAQLALKRISQRDLYDRVYRSRRAVQCSYQHKILPKNEWTKPKEDLRYLSPVMREIEKEIEEKNAFDSATVIRTSH